MFEWNKQPQIFMKQPSIKTPISYYGGKQKLVSKILPIIPEHKIYAETFAGGLAVFFGKPGSEIEVLNDTNKELINFYSILQNRYGELKKRVQATLHSRSLHKDAKVVYSNPHLFDDVTRAWSVWILACQSYCSKLDGAWGFGRSDNKVTKTISNKRDQFNELLCARLENVQIESCDALKIIERYDSPETFFYCDPPYFNSDCGHYNGYSEQDFENLLKMLAKIKGKFLLSSYPSDVLQRYVKKYGWKWRCYESGVTVNAKGGYLKRKWEMMTANYEI